VFLLSTYIASLALLLLSGVSLQRTTMDLRAAWLSRDRQQAFHLAEAGVNQAVITLRTNPSAIVENTTYSAPLSAGQYTYRVQTLSDTTIKESGDLEVAQQITATGISGNSSTVTVTAVLGSRQTLPRGLISNRTILIEPNLSVSASDNDRITVNGNVYSAGGRAQTVQLFPGTTVRGNITINQPDVDGGYSRLSGTNEQTDGVLLSRGWLNGSGSWTRLGLPRARVSGDIRATAMDALPSVNPPQGCRTEPLRVNHYQTLEVNDGDYLDLSPAGDGQILICVPQLTVGNNARLTVHQPTILHVAGGNPLFLDGGSAYIPVLVMGHLGAMPELQQRSDRGLIVVVEPTQLNGIRTDVLLNDFSGSVYAPGTYVHLKPDINWDPSLLEASTRSLGFVVADEVQVDGTNLEFPADEPESSLRKPASSMLMWTN
jgi:Tfp pilus assembly protein PilX